MFLFLACIDFVIFLSSFLFFGGQSNLIRNLQINIYHGFLCDVILQFIDAYEILLLYYASASKLTGSATEEIKMWVIGEIVLGSWMDVTSELMRF